MDPLFSDIIRWGLIEHRGMHWEAVCFNKPEWSKDMARARAFLAIHKQCTKKTISPYNVRDIA